MGNEIDADDLLGDDENQTPYSSVARYHRCNILHLVVTMNLRR